MIDRHLIYATLAGSVIGLAILGPIGIFLGAGAVQLVWWRS